MWLRKLGSRWWKAREAKLREVFRETETTLMEGFRKQLRHHETFIQAERKRMEIEEGKAIRAKEDLADELRRLEDRQKEIAQARKELADQLRLLEAKARPDAVWVQAFSLGFDKAWDMIVPLVQSGVAKGESLAMDKAMGRLRPLIEQRARELRNGHHS